MTWHAAMRWARIRARDTGKRYRVYGYPSCCATGSGWAYAVGQAE